MEHPGTLTTYERDKQAVAEFLHDAQTYLESGHRELAATAVHDLLVRLAEDRFNLAVVGQFKRGKSSLINAILGKDLLPTAVVPLTSIVTTLRHGPKERVLVRREGVPAPVILPTSSLADYVTERGNPNNEKRVTSVEVEVPASFLQRGLHLIDTPGVGSAHQRNTETTYAFLPEADAVIFVTSAESPLAEAELTFLDSVRQHAQRTFVVLNKVDQLQTLELGDVVRYAEGVIRHRLGEGAPGLFPLSATEALDGKRRGDVAHVEHSGVPAFEMALTAFLATSRGKALLLATLDRARRILDEERHLLALAREPRSAGEGGNSERSSALDDLVEHLTAERERLIERARAAASRWESERLDPILAEYVQTVTTTILPEMESRAKTEDNADPSTRREWLRTWWRQILVDRGRSFLLHRRHDWETAAQRILQEAAGGSEPSPSATDVDPEPIVMLRRVVPESPRPFALDARVLALPAGKYAGDDLLSLVPPPFTGWALRRQVRRDFKDDLTQLAGSLREVVRDYLALHVARLEHDSARILEDLRPAEFRPTVTDAKSAGRMAEARAAVGKAEEDRLAGLEQLVHRVEELRKFIASSDGSGEVTLAVMEEDPEPVRDDVVTARSPEEIAGAIEPLLEAEGCLVCADVENGTSEFLAHWQYLLATDDATQRAHRAAGGCCREHTWALEAVASPRGICASYPTVTDGFAHEIAGAAGLPSRVTAERLRRAASSSATCRLCAFQRRREEAIIRDLAALLETEEGRAKYGRTRGLCLPHLTALLEVGVRDEVAALLVDVAARQLNDVSAAMRGYALKIDARRRDLLTREEHGASRRALALLVGGRSIGYGVRDRER